MHQLHPDSSLLELCRRIAVDGLVFKLYTNNVTPDLSTVVGSFTEMSGGTGYAAVTIDDDAFGAGVVTAHLGIKSGDDIVFAVSSGSTSIYGYYVTNVAGSILLACGRFSDAPKTLDSSNPIAVTPKVAFSSRFAA